MEDEGRLDIDHWGVSEQSLMDHATLRFMSVIAERDAAVLERNISLAEKKAASTERDTAILERDVAYADRKAALFERDAAIAALEQFKAGHMNNYRCMSSGKMVGTKLLQVLAENPTFGIEECQNIQPANVGLTSSITEIPTGQFERQRKVAFKKKDGQKQSESKRKSDGFAPEASRPKKPQRLASITGKESNEQHTNIKDGLKDPDLDSSEIVLDTSALPVPVCSCTGVPRQCYRWGSGGWQSACCTTTISMYPLPMNPKKQGTRLAGRKMSAGAYMKVIQRLYVEGHSLSSAIDLKNHWARHGTNRFVTIS
eukprot:Gb_01982 [translate_table: standard]